MKKIAICPGSFDPITLGHLDIIERASKIFDEIIVLVMTNSAKTPMFTAEERVCMIEKATKNIGNIKIDIYNGLLADYAEENNVNVLVKGLRAVSDFEYEFQQALTNKVLNKNLETVYLNTSSDYMYLSSSVVKQIGSFGGDISKFVPAENLENIKLRLK